jgi:hypothetical protein
MKIEDLTPVEEGWLARTGGYARDMTLREAVALRVLPTFIKNDETELREDVDVAFLVADLFLEKRSV